MVRRLKADLRRLGEAFPERMVEPIPIAGLPGRRARARSLAPARRLRRAAQGAHRQAAARRRRRWRSSPSSACSSGCCRRSPAFARTLKAHRKTLQRLLDGEQAAGRVGRGAGLRRRQHDGEAPRSSALEDDERRGRRSTPTRTPPPRPRRSSAPPTRQRPTCARSSPRSTRCWRSPRTLRAEPDARVRWLVDWIKANLLVRHELERPPADHLHRVGGHAALARAAAAGSARRHRSRRRAHRASSPAPPAQDRREEVKRAFNADPAQGAAAHPDLHRCRARGHQPADPLLRPHPFRPAVEPVAPRAAQRPHRPQAAAGQAGRSAATSATSSARPTSCSRRWCARPR